LTEGWPVSSIAGDLGGPEAEHVAEHQRRALAGRQVLEGDHERQLDRLARLDLEQRVRVRVQPQRLDVVCWLERVPHRRDLPGAARTRAQRVEAAVGRDPVEPRAHRGAPLERLDAAPRGQERLLHHVLGVLHRADDAVAVQLQLAPVGLGQRAKRLLVAGTRPPERCLECGHHG
jgi:hypothetical protein